MRGFFWNCWYLAELRRLDCQCLQLVVPVAKLSDFMSERVANLFRLSQSLTRRQCLTLALLHSEVQFLQLHYESHAATSRGSPAILHGLVPRLKPYVAKHFVLIADWMQVRRIR